MTRESLRRILANVDFIGKPKLTGNNTAQYIRPNGDNVIRLHQTDVVITRADGSQILNSGGSRSRTVAARIKAYARGVHLLSKSDIWYLAKPGHDDGRIPFIDNVVIGPGGELPDVPQDEATRQIALGKKVLSFVSLLEWHVPVPSPGDCSSCVLRDEDGKHDTAHLVSQIDDGLLTASLIVKALRWEGHNDRNVELLMTGAVGRSELKRALRRYLQHKLGLAGQQTDATIDWMTGRLIADA